jgi:hypothetical protein
MAAAVCRTRVSVSWAVVGSSRDGESGRCDGVDAIALPSQTPRFHALLQRSVRVRSTNPAARHLGYAFPRRALRNAPA